MQQCAVVSRCGRFDIKAMADRTKSDTTQRITFLAQERQTHNAGRCFSAALSDEQLQKSAANSGFSPSVPLLTKMMFSALAGASATTSYSVVTCSDEPANWQRCVMAVSHGNRQSEAAPDSFIVLEFQLRGDFAPTESPLASFCVELRRVDSQFAQTQSMMQAQQLTQQMPQQQQQQLRQTVSSMPTQHAVAAVVDVANGSSANGDVAALTQMLVDTQRFLHQQREETVVRLERIYAELRQRANECAALRREVDALKAQAKKSSGNAGGFGSRTASTNRFPSPGVNPNNVSGGSQRFSPYAQNQPQRRPSPNRIVGTSRRFDSPHRPTSANRVAMPLTPNRSGNNIPVGTQRRNTNDGSKTSIGSGNSARMFFG